MENTQESTTKEKNIYLFSSICALLIVLRHSSNLHKIGPYIVEMNIDDNVLGKVCIAFQAFVHGGLSNIALYGFFMLSGYLFFRNYTYNKTFVKLKQRFRSVVIPYLLWHTIAYYFMGVLTNLPFLSGKINTEPYSLAIKDYFHSILFPSDIFWYLNYLIIFFLLSPALFVFIKSRILSLILLVILSIIFSGGENKFIFSLICFAIGGLIAIHFQKFTNQKRTVLFHISWSFLFVFGGVLATDILYGFLPIVIRLIITIIGVCCLWNTVNYVEDKVVIKKWMKQSFYIYCAHGVFYSVIKKIVYMLVGTNPIFIFIGWWIIYAINLFVIYISYKILEKCGGILKVLCGGR